MSELRRWPLLALLAGLSFLTSCGDGDDGQEAATTTTTEARGEDEQEAGGGDLEARLREAIEATRSVESMRLELDLDLRLGAGDSQSVGLDADFALDASAADLSSEIGGQADAIRILVLGDRAWVGGEGPDVRAALPAGAAWAALDAASLFTSPSWTDPGELAFLYLLNGAVDVEDEADGRYRFTLDLAQAIDEAPAELRDAVAEVITFDGEAEPEITGEVELDDEGRVVLLDIEGVQRPTADEVEALELAEGDEVRIALHLEIGGFDEDVEVEEPEAAEVVGISEAPNIAALLELETA